MYLNTRIRENQENMRYMDVNEAIIISTYFNILACALCSDSEHEAYIHHHSITQKSSQPWEPAVGGLHWVHMSHLRQIRGVQSRRHWAEFTLLLIRFLKMQFPGF